MEVVHFIILALSKKLVSVLVVLGVLYYSTKDMVPHNTTDLTNKDAFFYDAGPYMHQGVNNFIEVRGWDGFVYLASIELHYHKNSAGGYNVKSPVFVLVQKNTGITFSYSTLNIKDSDDMNVRYTCCALPDSAHPGTINLLFRTYTQASGVTAAQCEESNCFKFDSPAGKGWKAYVDSAYSQTSDTTALLKFRLVRM